MMYIIKRITPMNCVTILLTFIFLRIEVVVVHGFLVPLEKSIKVTKACSTTIINSSSINHIKNNKKRNTRNTIRWSKSKLFDDEQNTNDDNDNEQAGQDLAKKFYEQVRQRENQQESSSSLKSDSDINISQTPTPTSRSTGSSSGSSSRGGIDDNEQTKNKKFTGKQLGSPGIDGNTQQQTGGGGGSSSTPRDQMSQREFRLVNRAESAIPFQAAFALVVLCFYLYVGFTGGIRSGDELNEDSMDYYGGSGADSSTLIDNGGLPEPTDRESSYWL